LKYFTKKKNCYTIKLWRSWSESRSMMNRRHRGVVHMASPYTLFGVPCWSMIWFIPKKISRRHNKQALSQIYHALFYFKKKKKLRKLKQTNLLFRYSLSLPGLCLNRHASRLPYRIRHLHGGVLEWDGGPRLHQKQKDNNPKERTEKKLISCEGWRHMCKTQDEKHFH